MNKIESYIQERTLMLEKALVFHINTQIKKHFNTTEEYVKYFNNCNNHQFNTKLNNAFSIPSSIIKSICGDRVKDENGKRCRVVNDIKTNLLNRGNIILLKHFHEHYTDSTKDYTTVDRYLINPDKINDILFDDAKISDINSGYYTDLESQLIFKYIMNPDSYLKKFKNMKKRVKNIKNTSTQIETTEEQTKDELEMKNNKNNTTNKPDTQTLDIIIEKLNTLLNDMLVLKSQNETLKNELDEIKSSINNHTITKVEEENKITTYNKQTSATFDDKTFFDDNTFKPIPTKIETPEERELRKEKSDKKYKADMQKINDMISDIFKKPTEKEVKSFCGTKAELDDLVDDMI